MSEERVSVIHATRRVRHLLAGSLAAASIACGGAPRASVDIAPTSEAVPVIPAVSRVNDDGGLLNRVASLRVLPESLVVDAGARVILDSIRVLLIGKQGETLGRLHNARFQLESEFATLIPPDTIVALRPGRASLQLTLPNDLLLGWASLRNVLFMPVIVRGREQFHLR